MAQWIGDLIYFLALLAAIWYAWETRTMRLQMIRPKLVFFLLPHRQRNLDEPRAAELFVRNVGNGVALNITIERLQEENFKLRFEPEHIPILQIREQEPLRMKPVEGSYQPDMTVILDDPSIAIKLTARYLDVEGRVLRTSTVVGGAARPPFIS
jgi:hypothetical protein